MSAVTAPKKQIAAEDFKHVANALATNAKSVAQHLWPSGKLVSGNWRLSNIEGDAATDDEGSFSVALSGTYQGRCTDFATGESMDLLDAWATVNNFSSKKDALIDAANYIGVSLGNSTPVTPKPKKAKPPAVRLMNKESMERQVSKFWQHKEPMEYLKGRGIDEATAREFGLGLPFKPYKNAAGVVHDKALLAPVKMRDGSFFKKNVYINIPGFTENPLQEKHWVAKGMSAMTYYATPAAGQRFLFICEGMKDLWRHYQSLRDAKMLGDFLIITSTHGAGVPENWGVDFFEKFEKVYCGQDNDKAGDLIVERLLGKAGRELNRVKVPDQYGKDWTDYWNSGGTIAAFEQLLREAPVVDQKVEARDDKKNPQTGFQPGRRSYKPIDIRGAYHNGHMYYVTETINGMTDVDYDTGTIEKTEFRETVVVRSDPQKPKFFRAFMQPAPKGTPNYKRVVRLEDGTLINKAPVTSGYETWEFDDILDFVQGDQKPRSIDKIVADVMDLLKATVWLPYKEDYATLALLAPVTFVQKVFQSVPFILMNGPKGTGKSQVAVLMSELCCNGSLATAPTPAQVFRHIDNTQGFVAFDDLEAIGSAKGKDNGTDELMQVLKVSYNKDTAKIQRVDPKSMIPVEYNCFGVKLFTNILGSDSVLGSRMIRIQTKNMPDGYEGIRAMSVADKIKLKKLRTEMHAWAFTNVQDVADDYQKVYAMKTQRDDEIAAPLRVMANLVGDPDISGQLESTLARQKTNASTYHDSPEDALEEALRNLVTEGFINVTITHIANELASLMDANEGQEFAGQIPVWRRPDWIGKTLANHGLVSSAGKRQRFFGKSLRVQTISADFVDDVRAKYISNGMTLPDEKPVDAFCKGCDGCQYNMNGCDLQELRQKASISPKGKRDSVTH